MPDLANADHVLEAVSRDGIVVYVPLAGDASGDILMIERELAPNGWTGRFLPLTDRVDASRIFRAHRDPLLVEEADLFVQMRRAIITDPRNSITSGITERADALIAHLQPHRPLSMFRGPEDCLLGECDHDPVDRSCPDVELAGRICRACSAWYDPGSEYGLDWIESCRVSWPCPPVRNVAAFYKLEVV